MPVPVPGALPSAVEARIPTGTTVLFVPCASDSAPAGMYYQAIGGFRWSLVAGYAYYQTAGSPVAAGLCSSTPSAAQPQGAALEKALAGEGVDVILVPPGATVDAARIAAATGETPVVLDGFSVWVTGAG
jgi:hypothetical protein